MTSRSNNNVPPAQKKFTPVRPLLNQPPLNIENLPTRIQKGECNVLPPRFCPPMTLPPMTCPPTACYPCTPCQPPPCSPYCMPPNCYCPNPCSPCAPPPMCCPPPCQPIFVCPPACNPVQCPPCMPSPPPPPCCPPPPCAPPPCQPCVPKSGCCGGANSCCCGPKKQIICVPRRAQQGMMSGGCGSNAQPESSACSGKKNPESITKPGFGDQPASYNNCNFYLTEVPKSLKNRFGIGANSNSSGGGDEECIEEEEAEKCMDEADECIEDDECEEMLNFAAGDDQIVHPPVGYPGSKRSPWGAGYPGLADDDPRGPGHLFGHGQGRETRGGGTRDAYGKRISNSSQGRRGSGEDKNNGRHTGYRRTAGGNHGKGANGRGKNGSGSQFEGSPNGSSQNGRVGVDQYDRRNQHGGNQHGGNHHGGNQHGRDPYGRNHDSGRDNEHSGSHHGKDKGRYFTPDEDDDDYDHNGQDGLDKKGGRFGTGKSTHPNSGQLEVNQGSKGASTHFSAHSSGHRPYSYSNAELTEKSDAYLPEKYDVPTPHELNPSIHPSRAPITSYSSFNHPDDDYDARTIYSNRGKYKRDFGHMTAQSNRSQATMMPSCSTIPKTRHTHTSTRRLPSTVHRTTAAPSRSHFKTVGVGTVPPSKSHYTTQGVGSSSHYTTTGVGTKTPSYYSTAGVGTSRSMIQTEKGTRSVQTHKTNPTRTRSQPSVRQRHDEYEETIRPQVAHKTTTRTQIHTIKSNKTLSEHPSTQVSKQQSTARSNVTDDNDNWVAEDDGNEIENRTKRPGDPCHRPKTCFQYHTKRLHRLCSFSKQREKRLSDIHKPVFHFKKPACPIRETNASILRKTMPAKCQWHEQKVPAFHEYCMTDRKADTNRYPLLTREFSPLRHENENQHVGHNQNTSSHQQVEPRGAKRKNHHR